MLRGSNSLVTPGFAPGTPPGALARATGSVTATGYRWLVAGYSVLLTVLVLRGADRLPYDDSYLFKRFALNFLDHGVFAWNVSEGPVYGTSSQLFQLVVTAVTALTRTHSVFALRVLLALTLGFGFAVSLRTSSRRGALVATTLGFSSPVMFFSVLSGMETALAFTLLACLCAALDPEVAPELAHHWLVAPLLVVLLWLTRPDATLIALPLLIGLAGLRWQRIPVRELAVVASLVAACLVTFRLYYGSALPLPFYAKQRAFTPYDSQFVALAGHSLRVRFSVFAWAALPLLLLASTRLDAVNLLLLSSVALFELYHLITLVDITGMQGRFYAPALPTLIFAASRAETRPWTARRGARLAALLLLGTALLTAARTLPVGPLADDENLTRAYYLLCTLAGLAAVTLPARGTLGYAVAVCSVALSMVASLASLHPKRFAPPSDEDYLLQQEQNFSMYGGLETLRACFGDAISVYHSQLGVVGLRIARGDVMDLTAPLSRERSFGHKTFDQACASDQPAAIFLPQHDHAALSEELRHSRCLDDYIEVSSAASPPLHLRSDLYPRYERCARGGP